MKTNFFRYLIASIVLFQIPISHFYTLEFIPIQPGNPASTQNVQPATPKSIAQAAETVTPSPTAAPQTSEPVEPTRTPKPTATPVPTPPPSDPGKIRLMIGFGILAVIVIIFGVWINRQRTF
jgi:hypothetical protein